MEIKTWKSQVCVGEEKPSQEGFVDASEQLKDLVCRGYSEKLSENIE